MLRRPLPSGRMSVSVDLSPFPATNAIRRPSGDQAGSRPLRVRGCRARGRSRPRRRRARTGTNLRRAPRARRRSTRRPVTTRSPKHRNTDRVGHGEALRASSADPHDPQGAHVLRRPRQRERVAFGRPRQFLQVLPAPVGSREHARPTRMRQVGEREIRVADECEPTPVRRDNRRLRPPGDENRFPAGQRNAVDARVGERLAAIADEEDAAVPFGRGRGGSGRHREWQRNQQGDESSHPRMVGQVRRDGVPRTGRSTTTFW